MIVYQNFEWDLREAAANLASYGVSFKEAATVFAAENVAVTEDLDSDQLYARGPSSRGRTLIVLHTRGARIRILGAMVQQAEATTSADAATDRADRKEEDRPSGSEIALADAASTASTGAAVAQELEAPRLVSDANAAIGIASDAGPLAAAVAREPIEDVGARPANAQAASLGVGTGAERAHEEGSGRRRRRRRRRGGSPEAVATGAPEQAAEVEAHEAPSEEATGPAAAAETRAIAAAETRAAASEAATEPDVPATERDVPATEPRAAAAKKAPAPDAALRRGRPRRVPREDTTPPLAPAPSAPVAAAAPSSRSLGSGLTADEYEVYWAAYSAAREGAKGQGKSLKEAQRIGREAGERAVVAPRAPATASARVTVTASAVVAAPKPARKQALSWRAAARAVK